MRQTSACNGLVWTINHIDSHMSRQICFRDENLFVNSQKQKCCHIDQAISNVFRETILRVMIALVHITIFRNEDAFFVLKM